MVFNESNYIDITTLPKTFIYFLICDEHVVYVGQTRIGVARVNVHSNSNEKIFDKVYIIECDESDLDTLEDVFIKKYQPIYNKLPNLKCNRSLNNVKHSIQTEYDVHIMLRDIKKIITALNINTFTLNGTAFISNSDYELICKAYFNKCKK